MPRRDRESIAGTAAVAVLIAGGRWVSHFSVGPVYIGDVLLGAAFVHAVVSRLLMGRRQGRVLGPGLLAALVLLVAAIRLLLSQGEPRLVARDAAPFGYVLLAYLSARSYGLANERNRRRTLRLLWYALVLHLAWVVVALAAPGVMSSLPQFGESTASIRSDFDSALLGVLAGMSILRFRSKGGIWLNAALAGSCLALALAMQSRAGLLACSLCVLAALLARTDARDRYGLRTLVLVGSASLLLVGLLPGSPAGQRLIATVDSSAASTQLAGSAVGTVQARQGAWGDVVGYTLDDPLRALVGVGFGPDFLHESGADRELGGNHNGGLRSPHNFLLTTFARLGIVGLAAVVLLLLGLLGAAIRQLRAEQPDELATLCALLVIAVLVVSLLGVVLESPFGALPFFWAGGVLVARARLRRRARP